MLEYLKHLIFIFYAYCFFYRSNEKLFLVYYNSNDVKYNLTFSQSIKLSKLFKGKISKSKNNNKFVLSDEFITFNIIILVLISISPILLII